MQKIIKTTLGTIAVLCLFFAAIGIETDWRFGLLVIPFALAMWLSGGCYDIFYGKSRKKNKIFM